MSPDSPRKRLRALAAAAPPPPPEPDTQARTLPSDIVLEIVSRTDAATIVRSAACCKPLRRDILSPGFIRRVCQDPGGVVPAFLLGFLHAYDKTSRTPRPPAPFTLVHPVTPAAAAFSGNHVVPRLSRGAGADLLRRYEPLASRRSLVVLGRLNVRRPWKTDICVYNPIAGDRDFLPRPPGIAYVPIHMYVLLTAADGVGCSFLLLAADFMEFRSSGAIKIQTVSSDAADRKWAPLTVATHPRPPGSFLYPCCGSVVLGTLIHWLMYGDKVSLIITYGVGTTTVGSIELPSLPNGCKMFNLHLTSSPDGKLKLLMSDRLTVSIWQSTAADGWERQAVIDVEAIVWSLLPELPQERRLIKFEGSGVGSGAVLLRPAARNYFLGDRKEDKFVFLDLVTKDMRGFTNRKNCIYSRPYTYELDLASRLSAMKSF
ncbi:hypothetical protein EJB05_05474, partial [Eragrostis curvula]